MYVSAAASPCFPLSALICASSLRGVGRVWDVKGGELVASLAPTTAREISTTFKAQPDWAYVVVPHAG